MAAWHTRLLPRGLYGRALLIIVTPLIVVQLVTGWVFFDRHWDTVSRRLSSGVAGDISVGLTLIERTSDPAEREDLLRILRETLWLEFRVIDSPPPRSPPGETDIWRGYLQRALTERLRRPFEMDVQRRPRNIVITIPLPRGGLVEATVPRDRLFFSTAFLWLFWMIFSSVILLAVAAVFMRNQVRPIRRLAAAAEAFGKGRPVEDFKVVGAMEVRQAASAFRLMRERIARQIQQRTEMLAGVSHDLRTPLTRMKLGLALLPENEDTAALRDDVAEMQRMLDAYLAFARGEGTEEAEPVDIDSLIAEVVGGARRAGGTVEASGKVKTVLPVRPAAFKRCLDNLVGNAVRYARRVWVTARRGENAIEILIDDDGPGIPPDQREAVFRPFLRLEGSRNTGTGGIGLGLSIAREIVQGHGGTIRLAESPQGGLRVAVRLPL